MGDFVGISIAAFQATQLAFAALVKKGILPKAEAEQILRQAIEAMRTAGPGDRAAELLAYSPCRGSSRFHAASGVGNAGTARRKSTNRSIRALQGSRLLL